jgi:hypothetical protein
MALTKVTGQGLETLSDGVTITVNDNSDTLTIKSTDTDAAEGPILKLLRDGDSAADDDFIGVIKFNAARDDNNSDISYGKIMMFLRDASDGSEDGSLQIIHRLAGSDVVALQIDNDEYTFNDGSNDVDFRVEGNGDANLLFVDASADKVGIGTNTPSETLTVTGNFNATTGVKSLGVYNNTTGTGANVVVDSGGGFARSTSSRRYKNTIEDATHGLKELLALRSVTYKGNNDGDIISGGLIAEEVHDAGLTEFVTYNDKKEPDALAYGNMVSLCIKAIQELSAKNDALEASIAELKGNK